MSTQSDRTCRHAFTEALLEEGLRDPDVMAVTTDAKGSVTLGAFEERLPRQFIELGVAEQNSVGVAAGLARCGKKPFVCGPACFYSARAVEQIKNDVAYANTDVKVVGVSGGVSYGALGSTHHSLHDIAFMRVIPNMAVLLPCDLAQTRQITHYLVRHHGPVYMRVGRNAVPDVYTSGTAPFVFGRANVLKDGDDCTIIAAGETVFPALEAARILARNGTRARVLDMHTIKPLDREAVLRSADETPAIVTIEEHSIYGGLGSAVAELVVQHKPVPVRILGFPDEFVPAGSQQELFAYYGITGNKIADTVLRFLSTL